MSARSPVAAILLPFAALSLAACGGAEETERTYEAGVTDIGGGELIVTEPDPEAVQVNLPETPMVPVRPEAEGDSAAEPAPAE